jgi:hypothetical protein
LIDRTTLLRGDQKLLALAYKDTALQMAAPTIARGGLLSVQVFGRVAAQALNIYTVEIPTLASVGPAARDDAGQDATLAAALDVAVGLTKPRGSVAATALAQVTQSEGSDIGGAVGWGIDQLATDSSPVRDVLVETDGWITEPGQPPLYQVLAKRGPSGAASVILGDANVQRDTRSVTLLRMAGLASTSGYAGPGPQAVARLQTAWTLACQRLPVKECDISAQS